MIIHTFKIEKEINKENVSLFPSLIENSGRLYLIDCGYDETFENFLNELNLLNFNLHQIEGIIISHDDIDHLGGLKKFKEKKPTIKVYCSELEELSVSGSVKSERLIQAENLQEKLPNEYKNWALGFIGALKNIKRYKVDKTFDDGEIFEEDIQIVHTPGHTKGHISLFIQSTKTMIANDALVIENGEFEIANPAFTLDMQAALESVQKIKNLNPQKIICYHGGIMEENIDTKLNTLLSRYMERQVIQNKTIQKISASK
jgi:glyoxylase-like metal-dependent hydrolase (beta-lactamase superfamily II)